MTDKKVTRNFAKWGASPGWRIRFWILAAVLLWCAIPLSPNTIDSDFWGHVQYGADSLEHGLARTSTYAFTSEGFRWINHENLCEISFAWLTAVFGHQSVLVLKCLFGCLVIGLIIRSAVIKSVQTGIIIVVAPLVAVNLSFYWGLRPQVFSFTFFAIAIAMTEQYVAGRTVKRMTGKAFGMLVLAFVVLFALWANSHGGFVAGICVFNLLVGCRAVEAYVKNRDWQLSLRFCTLIITSSFATLANPYGYELHLWLVESLRVPRPEVTEWHRLDLFGGGASKVWAVLGLTAVGYIGTREKRDWAKAIVFVAVLLQALSHQRHLPFVAILFGFWVPQHLSSMVSRIPIILPTRKESRYDTPWFAIGPLAALCMILGFQVGTRLLSIEVPLDEYPVAAVQFMADHEIQDRIVVTGEWAQYVLAVAGARTRHDNGCRVAFDGRFRTCYPQSVVDMHFDFFRGDAPDHLRYRALDSPPPDPKRVLSYCNPNLVLLKTTEEFASGIMRESQEWCLLYSDQTAELWGRSEIYDQRDAKNYIAASQRVDASNVASSATSSRGSVEWPAKPKPGRTETALVSQSARGSDDD